MGLGLPAVVGLSPRLLGLALPALVGIWALLLRRILRLFVLALAADMVGLAPRLGLRVLVRPLTTGC